MSTDLDRLRQNYYVGFLRYLGRRDEPVLSSAYELGRAALSRGVSLLDVVQIHHSVLVNVLRDTGGHELPDVAEAASTFLVEVLASFDMTRRAFVKPGTRAEPSIDTHRPPG
jgi:Phosphoserine phosphatase RsbU, N-terminal domain